MIVRCCYDKLVPLNELIPSPRNRNSHSKEQIERLAKILNYQGIRYCIKVSKQSGFITSGHGRLMAAQLLGWTEFPVNYQDYDTTDQEYMDCVADNSIASWSELNLSGINTDLADLGPLDIDLLGIKDFALDLSEKYFNPLLTDTDDVELKKCPACGKKL